MSPTDPLYQALVKAWKARERRLDYRTGLVCAILCNVMGSGKKQFNAEDFMPVEPISREDEERALKANLAAYSIAQSKISK